MDVEINQTRPISASAILTPVFAIALFTSAALLFWVQPLIAKMLLPFLGGAASVWNTCMVFFQASLLAGYAYAMILSRRLSVRNQAFVHVLLLVAAGLVLPFTLESARLASIPTNGSPVLWLLGTLVVVVGPPFFLLSATAPLLQRWFSHSAHKSAHDPYFLYAVSNAGSMLSLLAFPFLLEPALTLRMQSRLWAIGYAILVATIIGCAFVLRPVSQSVNDAQTMDAVTVTNHDRFNWLLLAFVPSSLMLGVTTYIATDVASVPLIWIIPLALYLLTFILAFSSRQVIKISVASHLVPVAVIALGAFMIFKPPISAWIAIGFHLVLFFIAAFVCHRRLAVSRPGVSNLTEYYLWIATGGVLGGIFNALIAPLIFSTPLEYPLVVVLACLMRPGANSTKARNKWGPILFPAFVLLLTFGLSVVALRLNASERVQNGLALFLPLILSYIVTVRQPALFAFALAAFLIGAKPYLNASIENIVTERNFFGVWRVTSSKNEDYRRLWHGSTVHGVQFVDPARECIATSYYTKDGPLGQIFELYNSRDNPGAVAATGMGAGTVGTYASKGQQWDFYEIDPAIVRIVSDGRYFTFLSKCSGAPYRVLLGDARLRMRDAATGQYGLIIMDAFSSDSVPAHLLTTEAMDLYLSKLSADGLIAFHISNRYLDLEPLLSGLAKQFNLSAFTRKDEERQVAGRYPSIWVVLARNDASLGALTADSRWRRVQGNVVWTDDFSNILSLLK
jgi:spermidine synthase